MSAAPPQVNPLGRVESLYSLDLSDCHEIADISAVASCAKLHHVDLSFVEA